jgi:hypothetical protein
MIKLLNGVNRQGKLFFERCAGIGGRARAIEIDKKRFKKEKSL